MESNLECDFVLDLFKATLAIRDLTVDRNDAGAHHQPERTRKGWGGGGGGGGWGDENERPVTTKRGSEP